MFEKHSLDSNAGVDAEGLEVHWKTLERLFEMHGDVVINYPFTHDASGKLLQEAMMDAGLSCVSSPDEEQPELGIYIANLVK